MSGRKPGSPTERRWECTTRGHGSLGWCCTAGSSASGVGVQASSCSLRGSPSSVGHEQRPQKCTTSLHPLLILFQDSCFVVHLVFKNSPRKEIHLSRTSKHPIFPITILVRELKGIEKQPKCQAINEWIKRRYAYVLEYYSAVKKKELLHLQQHE